MDFVKSQLDRIQLQLKGLNASQKMLTASLVAIMVLTLLFYGRYAGTAEMEPVLGVNFTEAELVKATAQLDARGLDYKVIGGQIHTTADKRMAVMGVLSFNGGALPKNISSGFDQIIKQLTPWDGQSRSDALYNHGKQISLEQMIASWPNVASASVLIDPTTKRQIGGQGDILPTATVNILMQDRAAPPKHLATAAASLISGAYAGLKPENVKVTVDGQHLATSTAGPDGAPGSDAMLDARRAAEVYFAENLRQHLAYISDARVSVRVDITSSRVDRETLKYDKKNSIIEQQEQTNKIREDTSATRGPREAGALPNIGASLADSSAGGTPRTSNDSVETSKTFIAPAMEKEIMRTPAGVATQAGASVRVPRSWFVKAAAQYAPPGTTPDIAAVNAAEEAEIKRIRKSVMVCTGIKDESNIDVSAFTDFAPTVATALPAATASTIGLALGGHTKEIALGALALVSLFMVSMIVKKGTPALALATPAPKPRPAVNPTLQFGESFAGEAAVGNPLMDGMELDDEAVKTQQMLSQVSDMVDDNPDAAAALVKRWLNRS